MIRREWTMNKTTYTASSANTAPLTTTMIPTWRTNITLPPNAAGDRTQWQTVGVATTNCTYDAANNMLTAGNSTFTYNDKGNSLANSKRHSSESRHGKQICEQTVVSGRNLRLQVPACAWRDSIQPSQKINGIVRYFSGSAKKWRELTYRVVYDLFSVHWS